MEHDGRGGPLIGPELAAPPSLKSTKAHSLMTSSDAGHYRRPRTPAPIRALNWLGRSVGRDGAAWIKIDPQQLIQQAEKTTGLRDWGKEPLMEPLSVLCASLNNEARPNVVGRMVMRQFLGRILEYRLLMQRDFAQHPEILDVEIRRPVFITGLPRTGSTLLQRLMARDPDVRWLATWEMMFPSPPPDDATVATDPRIKLADRRLKMLNWAAPDFVMAHELAVGEPEECISLLQSTLVSNAYELMNELAGYRAWFKEQDLADPYRYYKRQLQLLAWKRPRDHWVLKCPVHLFALDAILEVFPDATIIQTHRDPVTVMPSVCSLFSVVQTLLSDYADPRVLGKEWLDRWAQACDDAIDLRARVGDERFIDIAYKETVRNPIATVRSIYERRDEPFTPAAEAAMQGWMQQNPQHKHGKHVYRLEDYGLNESMVRQRFGRYREHFAAYI